MKPSSAATGVQVVAVASVDHRPIGSVGASGLITIKRLRDLYFFALVRGQEPALRIG